MDRMILPKKVLIFKNVIDGKSSYGSCLTLRLSLQAPKSYKEQQKEPVTPYKSHSQKTENTTNFNFQKTLSPAPTVIFCQKLGCFRTMAWKAEEGIMLNHLQESTWGMEIMEKGSQDTEELAVDGGLVVGRTGWSQKGSCRVSRWDQERESLLRQGDERPH